MSSRGGVDMKKIASAELLPGIAVRHKFVHKFCVKVPEQSDIH